MDALLQDDRTNKPALEDEKIIKKRSHKILSIIISKNLKEVSRLEI